MVVDPATRDLIRRAPRTLMPECKRRLKGLVTPEFLQCQIEVGTPVCASIQDARDHLLHLRRSVSEVVQEHGLAMVAVSTHPFAVSESQQTTPKARYRELAHDLQEVVRRLLISGMHVHVGIDDNDLRIDLLGQVAYILPHLLALSTSSPFWKGHDTGLKSYRISVWDELPRTGLPEYFDSYAEYQRHVAILVEAGIIEDATKIWWDVRPSDRFPTLEMRIADICTRVEDGVCIAALYLCWLRMLYRLRRANQRWRRYALMLINENRWRAHRYGTSEGLIDFGIGTVVPYAELLEEILDLVAEDADALGCTREVRHARRIVRHGTSAHRQLAVYQRALDKGAEPEEALRKVVDALIRDTRRGIN